MAGLGGGGASVMSHRQQWLFSLCRQKNPRRYGRLMGDGADAVAAKSGALGISTFVKAILVLAGGENNGRRMSAP
jgi:hypothetical protein